MKTEEEIKIKITALKYVRAAALKKDDDVCFKWYGKMIKLLEWVLNDYY